MSSLVSLVDARRTFGGRGGVSAVSLTVPHGAIYALCGLNGAGKTTTLALLSGRLFAESGSLALDGVPVSLVARTARRGVGVVDDTPFVDDALTAWQWASFVTTLKGVPWPAHAEASAAHLTLDGETLAQPIRTLSFGTRRKIALWVEFMTTERLLVLDEPLIGLDPAAIRGFHRLATEFVRPGRAIIVSTHFLREAEASSTHIGVLRQGVTVADGPIDVVRGAGASLESVFMDLVEPARADV